MGTLDRLFGQREISDEEKKGNKAIERVRRRALARFVAVLSGLVFVLVTSVTLPPSGYAAFPGANGMIAFDSNRDGNEEIYVINADGTGQTRLTNEPASDHAPALDGALIGLIREVTNGNYALDSPWFQVEIEQVLGRRATKGKAGRPKAQLQHRRGQLDLV